MQVIPLLKFFKPVFTDIKFNDFFALAFSCVEISWVSAKSLFNCLAFSQNNHGSYDSNLPTPHPQIQPHVLGGRSHIYCCVPLFKGTMLNYACIKRWWNLHFLVYRNESGISKPWLVRGSLDRHPLVYLFTRQILLSTYYVPPYVFCWGRKTNRTSHKIGKFQCFKYSHGISTRDLGISGLPLNLPGEWGVLPSTYFDPCLQVSSTPVRTKTASLPVIPPFLMQPRTGPDQHLRVKRHLTHSLNKWKCTAAICQVLCQAAELQWWWGATGSCPPWAPIYWRLAPR